MEFISSDTNIWIDFVTIQKTELPFRLPYVYIMCQEAIYNELLSPPGLGEKLVHYGLIPVDFTIDEFFLAEQYGKNYIKLSIYDRIALSIAKIRQITLLTGDKALRNAAKQENVSTIGTLGILDKLWEQGYISKNEFMFCLEELS